ncbi:hypothetical protein CA11_28330 [Gimesia maris]|uniref:DUF7716 domain-containing protein n=1 Tax=Gimesia maris TaxID=122 RepID=UPI001189F33D|nr:hypothetical protein [Gimesia maris]QDU15020.1 hypothetical protein CA11_28330 [Gimesia maris]
MEDIEMATLQDIIKHVRKMQFQHSDWLYIAGESSELTLASEAALGNPDIDEETDEEILPTGFAERGLRSTIDVDTVSTCIDWADRLSGTIDDTAALDIIRYYIRFDAWPETLNAPDPPPPEESLRRSQRKYADNLGPENVMKECRREGCGRGTVAFSVFCRRHHFENIKNCPYPFDD